MTNGTNFRAAWHWILLFGFVAQCQGAAAGNDAPGVAVRRGLQFLQKEAFAWKDTHKCAACHHAATMLWTFNEAKSAGYQVDELALKQVREWAFGDMKTNSLTPQPPPRDVVNLGWVYVLLSMETVPGFAARTPAGDTHFPVTEALSTTNADPISAARRILIDQIISNQRTDGSWGKPLDERVPFGGPAEDVAILCRLALLQTGEHSSAVTAAIENSAHWLAANRDNTSRQSRNFKLLMNECEGQPAAELSPAIQTIIAEQNADGGWSQTPELDSDAYATGQSLYVLARAGVKSDARVMRRGVEFLVHAQREDGSWPMQSRVKAKNLGPITGAGTAWAVLGLVRAAP